MTDARQVLTIDDIRELWTDDGDLYLYAKGHWEAPDFLRAARTYLAWNGDEYRLPDREDLVTWGWARFVPHPEHGSIFWPMRRVTSFRGVFPYTLIEEVPHDGR